MKQDSAKLSEPVEAVLFDYGLVISAPPLPSAWERLKTISGLDEAAFHAGYWAYRHAYDRGTHTGEEYWHLAVAHSGRIVDDAQVEQLIAADVDLWGGLNMPIVEWIWKLQQAGFRTGILSNMGDRMAAGLLAKHDWLERFDHRTWSYTVKLAKPELEIYYRSAAGMQTAPDRILFVDDKPENIAAAEQAGMQAISYTDQAKFEAEMETRGLGHLLRIEDAGQWSPSAK